MYSRSRVSNKVKIVLYLNSFDLWVYDLEGSMNKCANKYINRQIDEWTDRQMDGQMMDRQI